MTQPQDRPPVYLPEPPRSPGEVEAPQPLLPRTTGPSGPTLPGLPPAWTRIIRADETVLWHGRADPRTTLSPRTLRAAMFLVLAMGMVMAAANNSAVPLIFGVFAFFMIKRKLGRVADTSDRQYLLTDRAAYLARQTGGGLQDVRAYPITPTLRLGLGPQSVSFASRFDSKGREKAEGFLDISDAAHVHALIRDIQKGQE